MSRRLLFACCLLGVLSGVGSVAWAQGGDWPEYPFSSRHVIDRGPGSYLSWWKLGTLALLLLFWVKTTDWVNRDCQTLRISYALWNGVVVFPFLAAFLISLLLPSFWISLPILALAVTVPLSSYIWRRNSEVAPHQRVLTGSHLRYLMASGLNRMGVKVEVEPRAAHERGAQVTFRAMGASDEAGNQSNLIAARQSEGFVPAKELLADAIHRRCEKLMLDYSREAVAVRYEIDGVWHEVDPLDRESGDLILFVINKLANLNVKERRQRQTGELVATFEGNSYPLKVFSQGTQTGQRVILQFTRHGIGLESLSDLGMRDKMQERLREMFSRSEGIFLFSAVPAGGLTTTIKFALKITDRYMRDFISFQAEGANEPLAENVELMTYDPAKDDPEQKLVSVLRREPNVLVVHQLTSGKMVEILCEHAQRGKLILAAIPAKEAVEALLRVLLLKVPARTFVPNVFGVLNQRLIRKLCEACKEPYTPAPDLLKKLGIPAGRVDQLYRPHAPSEDEPACEQCGGIGYFGRTAIFELLEVDQQVRQALIQEPKLEVLRKTARASGHLGLQEEGIALVAKGVTSLAELQRVLKQ